MDGYTNGKLDFKWVWVNIGNPKQMSKSGRFSPFSDTALAATPCPSLETRPPCLSFTVKSVSLARGIPLNSFQCLILLFKYD